MDDRRVESIELSVELKSRMMGVTSNVIRGMRELGKAVSATTG